MVILMRMNHYHQEVEGKEDKVDRVAKGDKGDKVGNKVIRGLKMMTIICSIEKFGVNHVCG